MNNTVEEVVEETYKTMFVKYKNALEKLYPVIANGIGCPYENNIECLHKNDIDNNNYAFYCGHKDAECWEEWSLKNE